VVVEGGVSEEAGGGDGVSEAGGGAGVAGDVAVCGGEDDGGGPGAGAQAAWVGRAVGG